MSNDPAPPTNATQPYSNDTSQREREEILRAEARASTYAGRAQAEANQIQGRFAAVEKVTVVGVETPDLPAPDWAHDASGQEPPTGYRIDEVEPVGTFAEIQASLAPAPSIPSPDVAVERAEAERSVVSPSDDVETSSASQPKPKLKLRWREKDG